MTQQINLFNPIFLKQKKHFSALTVVQGLGLILAGSIAMTVFVRFQLSDAMSEAARTSKQLQITQAQLAKVSAEYGPRQKNSQLEDEIQKVESELKSQAQLLELMRKGGFGNAKGYSEYLRAFSRQIVTGVWLTGFRISDSGDEIELRGRALQPELVAAYVNRLKNEPAMRGKSFAALQMQIPEVDDTIKDANGAVTIRRVTADYIEFVLHSAIAATEPSETQSANSNESFKLPGVNLQ